MKLRADNFKHPVKLAIHFSGGSDFYICNVTSFQVLEINGRIDVGYKKLVKSQQPLCKLFKGNSHVTEKVWTEGGEVIGVTVRHSSKALYNHKETYIFIKESVE